MLIYGYLYLYLTLKVPHFIYKLFGSFYGYFISSIEGTNEALRIIQWEDYRLHLLQSSPYNDSNRLEKYGYKVYSQNDEDGIIAEIFNRIGITNKIFVEFGVQNGLESNTHLLLLKDWKGLWIEGSESSCREINVLFNEVINGSHQLIVINEFITKDNINEIIQSANITGEIDLLSIDIDGNDWHIFNEISIVNPRVIVIEYNAKLPPDLEWVMPYNPSRMWDGSDYFGASLKAIEKLAEKKDIHWLELISQV